MTPEELGNAFRRAGEREELIPALVSFSTSMQEAAKRLKNDPELVLMMNKLPQEVGNKYPFEYGPVLGAIVPLPRDAMRAERELKDKEA